MKQPRHSPQSNSVQPQRGFRSFFQKEDWWAIWVGLGLVVVATMFYFSNSSIKWITILPPGGWTDFSVVSTHFTQHYPQYISQYFAWLIIFSLVFKTLGFRLTEFIPSFTFIYLFSIVIFILGQNKTISHYNLEPPLIALLLGLLIANLTSLPSWLTTGFRVEFYIKTGIVLLGATLPLTLIIWAGPVAILQASIVSISTFLVIYFVGKKLGLDQRLAATLGAGGAVCGVSASIAIAGAVSAKKEHVPVAITLVIIWAIVMIFLLPLASKSLHLPAGVAGAWIGSSEFADAAGFAAAHAYDDYAVQTNLPGNADDAVKAFTLMKVIGRDVWIGIWAFVLAIVATSKWDNPVNTKPDAKQIWERFPKFVIGFLLSSVIVTLIGFHIGEASFKKLATPDLIKPLKDLRTWAFIFSFFSIGLTTKFKEFNQTGYKPLIAFTAGVIINVTLGFILSTVVFANYWTNLTH